MLALATTQAGLTEAISDRDFLAALGRLQALGLDQTATIAELAGALVDPTEVTVLKDDQAILLADAAGYRAFLDASSRLALLGLDGTSSPADIQSALDKSAEIELALLLRAELDDPNTSQLPQTWILTENASCGFSVRAKSSARFFGT